MKAYARIRMIGILALFVLVGLGLAQAAQAEAGAVPASYRDSRWFKSILDGAVDTGAYISIALDPDTEAPWVSYYKASTGDLKVSQYVGLVGGNCGPGNTWHCDTVDSTNDVGQYSSIDVYRGAGWITFKVGVSYSDLANNVLRFAEYSYKIVGGWAWRLYNIDVLEGNILVAPVSTAAYLGRYTSLKYDSTGVPHIAYHAAYAGFPLSTLRYASRVTTGGNCGDNSSWQCETIDSSIMAPFGSPGPHASLDISWLDRPYIAYYDLSNADLKYAWLSHPSGGGTCGPTGTWSCVTVDSSGDVGKFASMHAPHALYHDPPQIAYYDATNGKLKYAYAVNSGGNCGVGNNWQCDAITNIGMNLPQVGISLAVDKSLDPVIAYMDASEDLAPISLHIAYPKLYGNCGPETPFATWQCSLIDGGGGYFDEAAFVSIAVNSSKMATIAYSELDKDAYPNVDHVKIAYQRVQLFMPIIGR